MGLDLVELVLGWEEAFGITITDSELARLHSPRTTIDFIVTKVGAVDRPDIPCLAQRAFHRLRRGLVDGAGVSRSAVRPEARMRNLLPFSERKENWHALRSASGLTAFPEYGWRVEICFPCETIAGLVEWTASCHHRDLKPVGEPWTRAEIRFLVRFSLKECSGIKDFSDDADFCRDLNLD